MYLDIEVKQDGVDKHKTIVFIFAKFLNLAVGFLMSLYMCYFTQLHLQMCPLAATSDKIKPEREKCLSAADGPFAKWRFYRRRVVRVYIPIPRTNPSYDPRRVAGT